jgi:hypothetical protein
MTNPDKAALLREKIARLILDNHGCEFCLDPLEGGEDDYCLTLEVLADADDILALIEQPA